MKQILFNHIKNIFGWKTKRKIVVFSVDDYGNVRINSKNARENLDKAGLKIYTRFDAFDTLETREDLEELYEVLISVKDKKNRTAIFTPYALPCNINFEAMEANGYAHYQYELLPNTFEKLEEMHPFAYKGTWNLWKEGIDHKLMKPQFHGREHINLKIFNDLLEKRDPELLANLKNRSFTSINAKSYKNLGYTAAFSFQNTHDLKVLPEILRTGLEAFEQVFGYSPKAFTPPASELPKDLEKELFEYGLLYLDKPFHKSRHMGDGKYEKEWNISGYDNKTRLVDLVRNVVFEPTDDRGFNWVDYAFKQIETAFFWGKPANISSHRVNFCGHMDPNNRKQGLDALKQLLKKIVDKYPEVEFMSADELGDLILKREGVIERWRD